MSYFVHVVGEDGMFLYDDFVEELTEYTITDPIPPDAGFWWPKRDFDNSVWVEGGSPPIPTEEEIRAIRDDLLLKTDKYAIRFLEIGTSMPAGMAEYRQSLRDIPEQEGFPANVVWPINPLEG